MTAPLDRHFFRHEYGRLVAMLSRSVGLRHLEVVEDAAQSALLVALESWTISLLERLAPCALHTLNRAVAVAEWRGPADGLAVLKDLEPPSWLADSYLWAAVLADLHRRCGHDEVAQRYLDAVAQSAPTAAVRDLLRRRHRTCRR